MNWRKLYKESNEGVNLKKLLKLNGVTKFPPSTDFWKDSISWFREETGFTGEKHLRKMAKQLEDAGWKKLASDNVRVDKFLSPDGKVVATLDITIVRTRKWYSITFKCANTTNESVDDEKSFKKLLRQNGVTKLPSGTKLSYDGKLEWSKHKGYAGQKTIRNMCIQLEHAGWKRGDWSTGGTPDGSSVANSNNYTSPDGRILMSYTEYYGSTSYDNSFYITFKLVGDGLVSESAEEREYSIECWVPCNKTFKVMASDGREAKQKVEAEVKELLKAPPTTLMDVLKDAGFEIIPDPETWLDTYTDAY